MNATSLLAMLLIAAPPEPRFAVRTNGGESITAGITAIKADGELSVDNGKALKAAEWFGMQRETVPRPAWPTDAQAILASGDRVAGAFLRGDDQSATLKTAFGEIKIPFSMLDVLWLSAPPADTPTFSDRYPWLPAGRKHDAILLANDEVLSGDIEGFSDMNELRLNIGAKPRTLPAKVIQAIAFNPALTVRKAAGGVRYHIVTASGSRFTAKQLSADAKNLQIVSSFGAKLTVPWNDLAAVTRWSNDIVPLSELTPTKNMTEPFGDLAWPSAINRSVKAKPLTLKTANGIETFDNGLGTHPKSSLVYDLAGKYRTFETTVGLDAMTGRRGVVVLKILVDSKVQELSKLNPLSSTDGPQTIRVDVTKAKTLTLITDFGPNGDVQADVNWIESRLLK